MESLFEAIHKKGGVTDDAALNAACKKYVNGLNNATDILSIFQYYTDDQFRNARWPTNPTTDVTVHNRIPEISVLRALKKRCLELYSSLYGLTPLHVDCATKTQHWSDESERYLQTGDVDATTSEESPLWPMTSPLLIAAKFENYGLVQSLLDLGADPATRDFEGNTPLHYLSQREPQNDDDTFYDERLFVFDGSNTFGSVTGETHFHIACRSCPLALKIVKRYLDQGVSPNLPMEDSQRSGKNGGKVGLHLAAEMGLRSTMIICPELVLLLLEYGADVKKKDIDGRTPLDLFISVGSTSWQLKESKIILTCVCLIIEAGSIEEELTEEQYKALLSYVGLLIVCEALRLFLSSVKKFIVLNKNLVGKKWKNLYRKIANAYDGWNEADIVALCSEELSILTRFGLRPILDGTLAIKSNFMDHHKMFVDSLNRGSYPIYGNSLRFKLNQKLLKYKKKKSQVEQAIPKVRWLFQEQGCLPLLCAEKILWEMNVEELSLFINDNISIEA